MRIVPAEAERCVIVLDDDQDSRDIFAEILQSVGFAVHSFASAETMLACFEDIRPLALVTDITLAGDIDGYQAARIVRTADPQIGLIALTGHAPDIVRSQGALFDFILRKPCTVEELINVVKRFAEEAPTKNHPIVEKDAEPVSSV